MELDAEDSAAAIGNAGDMQQQGAPEELLPNDPFGNGDGHAAWVRLQLQQMLQDATEIVEDEADDTAARRLSERTNSACKQPSVRLLQTNYSSRSARQSSRCVLGCGHSWALHSTATTMGMMTLHPLGISTHRVQRQPLSIGSSSSSSSRFLVARDHGLVRSRVPMAGNSSRVMLCAGLAAATRARWALSTRPFLAGVHS